MNAIICKRCGAPLHSSKCEYCGVEYLGYQKDVSIQLDESAIDRTMADYLHEDNRPAAEIASDMWRRIRNGNGGNGMRIGVDKYGRLTYFCGGR